MVGKLCAGASLPRHSLSEPKAETRIEHFTETGDCDSDCKNSLQLYYLEYSHPNINAGFSRKEKLARKGWLLLVIYLSVLRSTTILSGI
jgi:hypothetical protein